MDVTLSAKFKQKILTDEVVNYIILIPNFVFSQKTLQSP